MLKAQNSDWMQSQISNDRGEFQFRSVPLGNYTSQSRRRASGKRNRSAIVQSDTSPVLHFGLVLAGARENVEVSETPIEATTETVTPTTMLNRIDIQETPGADRTNGMEMITDYVPAAYVTHDMLHMRGGHQVEWLIDGVPIPNTNIANNLGPQIDPKDIDYLEVQRGSYDADYGDRTYGIFNVVPRTGFERDRECDLVIAVGNFYQTDDQISCGATHGPLRLLRQPERQPQQLRSSAPDFSGCPRRREWIRRIRVLHLQLRSEKSVSCGRFPEAGLLPDPHTTPIPTQSEISSWQRGKYSQQWVA